MLYKSTIQLLRFPFSYFLMPVFWFALSLLPNLNLFRSLLVFGIIHLLVYPASNGYNSYMDRDEESIGGIKKPMQPTRQLFYVSVGMDALAVLFGFMVSSLFAICIFIYIVFSRLYSYRGVRLKKYPFLGYLVVILNQGALTFFMVYYGCSRDLSMQVPWQGMLAATLLIGGFYPITQVYQHQQDAKDGVTTISMKLGKRGTFIFTAMIYSLAFSVLFMYFRQMDQLKNLLILQLFFLPVLYYFFRWFSQVWKNESVANHTNTMRMNWIASTCTNGAFITLLILNQL